MTKHMIRGNEHLLLHHLERSSFKFNLNVQEFPLTTIIFIEDIWEADDRNRQGGEVDRFHYSPITY